ncbi:hypothetical protein EDC94DRAFT_580322 [Helicostylum pulchrum]|nr:hypothetical protein EDC94DRAFT_580322 [Helicostylum pulchrum]
MELVMNGPSTSPYNGIKGKNELRTAILPAAIENHMLNVEVDDSGAITNPLSIECIRNKLIQWNKEAIKIFGNMHGHIFNNTSKSMINMQQDQQEPPEVVGSQQEFQEEEEPQPQPHSRQQQKQIGVMLNQQLAENIKSNPPKENDKLIIEGFDFSQAFYELQLTLLNLECPIILESHVQQALQVFKYQKVQKGEALSSILLVKPDRMHEDLMNAFDWQFNNLMSYLKSLFEEVNNHQITRDKVAPERMVADFAVTGYSSASVYRVLSE